MSTWASRVYNKFMVIAGDSGGSPVIGLFVLYKLATSTWNLQVAL